MSRTMPDPTPTAAPGFEAGAAFVDGEQVPIGEAKISIVDTGFSRSDVTYDVVGVWDGAFFRLDDHLERFERSCRELRMTLPHSRGEMAEILIGLVRTAGLREAYVETICTRGVAGACATRGCSRTASTPTRSRSSGCCSRRRPRRGWTRSSRARCSGSPTGRSTPPSRTSTGAT